MRPTNEPIYNRINNRSHKDIRLFLVPVICLFWVASGCENGIVSQSRICLLGRVIISGNANISLPCPIRLKGVDIGKALEKKLDDQGRPFIIISIPYENTKYMKEVSAFWINNEKGDACLNYEVLFEDSPSKTGEYIFLGFESYGRFVLWKAKAITKKTISDALDAISAYLKAPDG